MDTIAMEMRMGMDVVEQFMQDACVCFWIKFPFREKGKIM